VGQQLEDKEGARLAPPLRFQHLEHERGARLPLYRFFQLWDNSEGA